MVSPRKPIADALRNNKNLLAEALLESIREWDKYANDLGNTSLELQEFVRRELVAFVDYLITSSVATVITAVSISAKS